MDEGESSLTSPESEHAIATSKESQRSHVDHQNGGNGLVFPVSHS